MMASVPCDRHGEPRPGRIAGMYPVLLTDGVRTSSKRRFCLPCIRAVVAEHSVDWLDSAFRGEHDGITACTRCGQIAQSNAALARFYCTVYLDGKNRRDYMAFYCYDCSKQTTQEFVLA